VVAHEEEETRQHPVPVTDQGAEGVHTCRFYAIFTVFWTTDEARAYIADLDASAGYDSCAAVWTVLVLFCVPVLRIRLFVIR
jgi:hypothetical protein